MVICNILDYKGFIPEPIIRRGLDTSVHAPALWLWSCKMPVSKVTDWVNDKTAERKNDVVQGATGALNGGAKGWIAVEVKASSVMLYTVAQGYGNGAKRE